MKIWDIAKSIGATALQVALPGTGSLIVNAVNEFLPDNQKLPATATGHDIETAIDSLPAEQRAAVMLKEFDVDIAQIQESNTTLRAMLASDAVNPHSTRPRIALGSFYVVAFVDVVVISTWAYGVVTGDEKLVSAIVDGWQFVLAVIAPLVALLWAYFGILKQEHKNTLDAANGAAHPPGLVGLIKQTLLKG